MSINFLGEIEVEVSGVKGKSCVALTQHLEDALGTVDKRQYTPEFRENDVIHNQQLRQRS